MSAKTFKWTVEIEVAESEVADGVNLTDAVIMTALERRFCYTPGDSFRATVVKAPSPESIAIVQGAYKRLGWARGAGSTNWHVAISIGGVLQPLCEGPLGLVSGPTRADEPPGRVCPECKARDQR